MQIQVSDLNETLVSLKLRMLDQAYLKGHILPVDKNTPFAWRFRSTDWLAEPDELIQEYSIDTTTSTTSSQSSTAAASGTQGSSNASNATASSGTAAAGSAKQSSKSSKAKAKQDKDSTAVTTTTTTADANTVQLELPSVKYAAKTVGDSIIASDSCELVILEQGRCVKPDEVEIPLYLWIPHDDAMQSGLSYADAVTAGLEIPSLQSQLDIDDALQQLELADAGSDTTDTGTSDDTTTIDKLKADKTVVPSLHTPGKQSVSYILMMYTYTAYIK
jgi:hypothetical protein